MKKIINKLSELFKLFHEKIVIINDSPQKIALGFGLGVFLGMLPGTGPVAALCLAFLFRLNRASALIGSLLTNTWLSIVTFIFAVKLGALTFAIEWHSLYRDWSAFLKGFHFSKLINITALKIALPVMIGYLEISLFLGLLAYLTVLILIINFRRSRKK